MLAREAYRRRREKIPLPITLEAGTTRLGGLDDSSCRILKHSYQEGMLRRVGGRPCRSLSRTGGVMARGTDICAVRAAVQVGAIVPFGAGAALERSA